MSIANVGDVVRYRQRHGSQAWLPAVVTVTEESYVPGLWRPAEEVPGADRLSGDAFVRGNQRVLIDAEGEIYVPSELPPVKEQRLHLRVLSPTCNDYAEFNVPRGVDPGCWYPVVDA